MAESTASGKPSRPATGGPCKPTEETLHPSEERYRAILHAAMDGFWMADTQGHLLDVNAVYSRMSGYSEQELLAMRIADVEAAESSAEIDRHMRQIIAQGEVRFETRHRRKDGSIFDVEVSAQYRPAEGGRVVSFLRDITERKRVEQNVRQSEEKYRSLVQKIQAAVIVHGPDTRILTCNPMAMDLLGLTEDQILGKAATEAVFNIFREDGTLLRVEDYPVNQVIAKRQALRNLILRVHYPHKEPKKDMWVLVNADPVFSNEAELVQVVVTFVDMTARKQAEEELQKLASVVRNSSELVNLAAFDGTMTFLNEAGAKMLGIDMDKVNQVNIMQVIPDHLKSKTETEIFPALKDQGKWEGELQYRNLKTGQLRDMYTTMFTVKGLNTDAPLFLANVSLDITERKRAEQEKAELEAQLQQAQKLESVGRLAGGVAHDFNNMLGVILGYAELAMSKVNPCEPLHADLAEIITAAERSVKVTRQLLAFARKQTVAPKVLDINETVASMHKMLERIIGEQIRLDWQPDADLWPVMVDPAQIDQIVANLCVNARDAISGGGKITIATGNRVLDAEYCGAHPGIVPGEYVRLAVSDDGSGMDQETLTHIFEPFFTTKGVGEGTGLGLAMVYGAVQQNNGFITAESVLGKGTTFTIYLPRHVGKCVQPWTEATPGVFMGGRETILLVEDEPAVLALTATMLENQGYTVLAVNTPDQAVALAREHAAKIHLLLTDVVMPGMNGRDLWCQVSALRPDMKCAYMSGYPAAAISHHGVLKAGAHFIQKPFAQRELAAKVRAALDGK